MSRAAERHGSPHAHRRQLPTWRAISSSGRDSGGAVLDGRFTGRDRSRFCAMRPSQPAWLSAATIWPNQCITAARAFGMRGAGRFPPYKRGFRFAQYDDTALASRPGADLVRMPQAIGFFVTRHTGLQPPPDRLSTSSTISEPQRVLLHAFQPSQGFDLLGKRLMPAASSKIAAFAATIAAVRRPCSITLEASGHAGAKANNSRMSRIGWAGG